MTVTFSHLLPTRSVFKTSFLNIKNPIKSIFPMKRFNSLQNCSKKDSGQLVETVCHNSKSLPNIEILVDEGAKKPNHGLKRQNSKKIKILQKTWDKVKTIIHPSGRRSSRTKQSPSDIELSPRNSSPLVKCLKFQNQSCSAPNTPSKKLVFDFEPIVTTPILRSYEKRKPSIQVDDPEIDQVVKNYVELQKRLSEELHQSMKDDKRKDEGLSDDFKKRLQQWDMWKASTGKYHYTEEELQKLIPVEFSKKLQEWEDMKSRPREEVIQLTHRPSTSSGSTKIDRKKKKTEETSRQKELAWLEKQLEKIEIEKRRLEREMVKYCEREIRLQKMKEVLRNNPNPKQEVWIKTPTAECKLEGISEKFTKKLYKWEEKQGIQPECSTMAFLNPKYFASTPEQHSPEIDTNVPLSDLLEGTAASTKQDYSSPSEASEADEEYEEATDSFATKDEPASGASNTDSECFNVKSGFRRRSSDAISTPLSARSPSPSCCTSDDEENFMLQTVNEYEEEKLLTIDEKPVVMKAKPIVVEVAEPIDDSLVIVRTQRTIFTPVDIEDTDEVEKDEKKVLIIEEKPLASPTMVKNIYQKMVNSMPGATAMSTETESKKSQVVGNLWEKDPPRVVGAIRKNSDTSSTGITNKFRLPPLPNQHKVPIKDLTGKQVVLGKIPVWCSPLMTRRRFLDSQQPPSPSETLSPHYDFSLDKFLQETNLTPIPPPRPSRIPVTSSPGYLRRKYTVSGENLLADDQGSNIRLVSLTRSNSFQCQVTSATTFQPKIEVNEQTKSELKSIELMQLPSSVTKSKSTGSILGGSGTKGLFGFANKLVNKSDSKPKRQILPSWLKNSSSSATNQ